MSSSQTSATQDSTSRHPASGTSHQRVRDNPGSEESSSTNANCDAQEVAEGASEDTEDAVDQEDDDEEDSGTERPNTRNTPTSSVFSAATRSAENSPASVRSTATTATTASTTSTTSADARAFEHTLALFPAPPGGSGSSGTSRS